VLAKVAKSMNVNIEEVDIDSDDELTKLYGLRVPVVLGVHGRVLAEGVIDDRKLLKDALQREVDL
jgi:hypothetical protein